MSEGYRSVGLPGAGVRVDVAGDQPNEGSAVVRRQERQALPGDVLVARFRPFSGPRKIDPQLDAVHMTALDHQFLAGQLVMEDAGSGGHPLGVAIVDDATPAVGVVMNERAVHEVRDGLETAVRMPRRALGFVGFIRGDHVVEQEERVGLRHRGDRERSPDGKTGTFGREQRIGHLRRGSRRGRCGRSWDAWQYQSVRADRRHGSSSSMTASQYMRGPTEVPGVLDSAARPGGGDHPVDPPLTMKKNTMSATTSRLTAMSETILAFEYGRAPWTSPVWPLIRTCQVFPANR